MNGAVPRHDAVARRFPRYRVDARLSVQVHRVNGTFSFWGRTSELGADGIGGTLTGELEPGEVVAMELALPLVTYPLKFRAIVRYRQGLRHGFEFLALSAQQHAAIEKVCEFLASGQ
ncbi:MAG TPA: PilZ domain-containing protein [Terriglobales bacterium]|jgi:hypothetical protein